MNYLINRGWSRSQELTTLVIFIAQKSLEIKIRLRDRRPITLIFKLFMRFIYSIECLKSSSNLVTLMIQPIWLDFEDNEWCDWCLIDWLIMWWMEMLWYLVTYTLTCLESDILCLKFFVYNIDCTKIIKKDEWSFEISRHVSDDVS